MNPPTVHKFITVAAIVQAVATFYSVTPEQIKTANKVRTTALARHVCMHLARRLTRSSLDYIGELLGGRDPSTVRSGAMRIEAMRATDPELARQLELLETELRGEPARAEVLA